ncbi:MAG: AAA family ATPase [Burkholderiales bacterium]|nr:AAA family ATPase [Burkholderiales bacterium]
MPGIRQWLEAAGLPQYADAFERNDIDVDILADLSEQDLHRLGVSLGHGKRILRTVHGGADPAPARQAAALEGERRQVTVLFCDLVGSTELSSRLDPEAYRVVLSGYHQTAIRAIQRFDGYVAQVQGDGILAYFGYPLAHEGEADRAIRAALEILAGLRAGNAGGAEPLGVRIGIASGLVVVSHILASERSAVGETPNLAHRLQATANAGEILVAARTRELAGGGFGYEDCGPIALKGIPHPVHAYRVTGPSAAASRFDASLRGRLTPLVGRAQEVGLLLDRWSVARAREGHVVLLQGEPGIGKSRLLRALCERLGERLEALLQFQCSPYYSNSAFYPFVDQLERALGCAREDGGEARLERLEGWLQGQLGRSRTECSLLARAMAIECEQRYGVLEMSPQRQKEDTVALLVDLIAQQALRRATAVLFEDVHWADPTTVEVLTALVDRAGALPLLVVITYRPEFTPPWLSRAHVTLIALNRLSRAQGASLVLGVVGDKPLPAELVTQIVDRTDGVPLFLEELTKAVRESELLVDLGDRYGVSGRLEKLSILDTLRDSLMARLDRLIPVKEIAQIGAVIGRQFSHELVRAVTPMGEAQLREALERLSASGLVFRRGTGEQASYLFKHALVQDAAYDSLLLGRRQGLHAQIAAAIEARFAEQVRSEPELLAHHYTEAGRIEQALPYWQRAGELAQQRVALQEAIGYFQRGLESCLTLEQGDTREQFELRLRALLGIACVELNGYTHPQVAATLEPALRLKQGREDAPYTLRVRWGIWVDRMCRGEVEESLSRARELAAIAEEIGDPGMQLVGDWVCCNSLYFLGDFHDSIRHADRILERYDGERDAQVASVVNHDPKTIAYAYRAAAQWRCGFPARAMASARLAVEHSMRRGHHFNLCWVRCFLSHTLLADARDTDVQAAYLDHAERVAAEQKLPFFTLVYGPLSRAFWRLHLGDAGRAATAFQQVTQDWIGAGLQVWLPYIKAAHAQALMRIDDVTGALHLLDEGLEQIARPGWGERGSLSEVLRLKAECLRRSGPHHEVVDLFEESLSIARAQGARAWELRTATSYAEYLNERSEAYRARALLQPVYEWFSEGHGTGDLQDAKRLLERMSQGAAC